MTRLLGILLLCSGVVLAADPDPEPPDPNADRALNGDWRLSSSVRNGKPDDIPIAIIMRLDRGKMTMLLDKLAKNGSYKVNTKTRPPEMDMVAGEQPMTSLCIYKVEGDRLTIATGEPGQARPKDFATGQVILTFTRVKK